MRPDPAKIIMAALFAAGNRGATQTDLREMLELTPGQYTLIWDDFLSYVAQHTPFIVQCIEGRYSLVTDPAYGQFLKRIIEKEKREPLTEADNQVLILIAYGQPLSRKQIDYMRGSDSEWNLAKLRRRALIVGNALSDAANAELYYGTTSYFLTAYGFSSLSDLPPCPAELAVLFERCERRFHQQSISRIDANLA